MRCAMRTDGERFWPPLSLFASALWRCQRVGGGGGTRTQSLIGSWSPHGARNKSRSQEREVLVLPLLFLSGGKHFGTQSQCWSRNWVAILVYIGIRYNTPTRIIYIQTFIRQIKAKQTKVQHLIQEYCTSLKAGILYNRENRNFVQHRKQEYCTSLND